MREATQKTRRTASKKFTILMAGLHTNANANVVMARTVNTANNMPQTRLLDMSLVRTAEFFDWIEFPRVQKVVGLAQCPKCGKFPIELIAETDGWVQEDDGSWTPDSFGLAMGVHCGLLLAETDFDGTVQAFDLRRKRRNVQFSPKVGIM